MGAALPIVAIGLQAGSQLYGGIEESRGLRAEARALDENARLTERDGAMAAVDAYRASRLQMGEDMAALAGSGGITSASSGGDIIAASAIERELQVMNIRYSAGQEAKGLRAQAKDRRRAAKGAIIGGVLGAAASAVQGAMQMRSQARVEGMNAATRAGQRSGYGIPIPTPGSMGAGLVDPRRYGQRADPRLNY